MNTVRKLIACAMLFTLAGCTALGAAGGGYAGYKLGCKPGSTKAECAGATGAGAVGGAIIGDTLD